MKKLILFLCLAIGFLANAQIAKVVTPLDFSTVYFSNYIGTAVDTLGTVTATTWSYEIPVNKSDGLYYVSKIKIADKTTGANGVCTIKWQGKYLATDNYTDITTVQWVGVTSTDTTIVFSNINSKLYYSYFRQLVTNTSGKSKIVYTNNLFKK